VKNSAAKRQNPVVWLRFIGNASCHASDWPQPRPAVLMATPKTDPV